jgi:hypothetical protein
MLNSIKELKKADKIKEVDFGDVKVTIKVITTEDEIESHLFSKEYSEKYPEKDRGYIYIQKLKQEVVVRSIVQINEVKFEYANKEEKERIITALRSAIKELGESIIQILYESHNLLMLSYKDEYDVEIEKMIEDDIQSKEQKDIEKEKEKNEKENIEIKLNDIPKTKEEIEKNNKIIEKEFDSRVENGKIIIESKKDIEEIKKELAEVSK